LPSVEAIADWLRDVLDALRVERAYVVGHSLGALAAVECAARHPERVERLALLGPSAPMPVSEDLLAAAARNDHVAYELINGWSFSADGQLGGNRLPGVWMLGNAMRLMERTRDDVLSIDLVACNVYANGLAAAATVRCPTLVVVGERDIMAPPRNAKALIAALPDVRSISLPRTGHSMMTERPDEVLDALRAFLQVGTT
jgi:pimeloyl-ACP methyl ester carboxylesterase